jgi:hypothetical protein
MRKKIYRVIEKCEDCLYLQYDMDDYSDYYGDAHCDHAFLNNNEGVSSNIKDDELDKIPKWCPLEDD